MIPVIPWYITIATVATNLAIAVVAWSILSVGAGRSALSPADRRRVRVGSAVFLGAWLGSALLLAPTPASVLARDPFAVAPQIPLFFLAPFATAAFALWRSAALRQALAAASVPVLHAAQVWRTAGIMFIVLLAQGQLPAHFALPAGWGDVAVGLTAPLVALALARGLPAARALGITWNALGLLDLVVAVGTGSGILVPLLVPGPGPHVAAAAAMGAFPMILVPTFAVPVSVMLHLIAIKALVRGRVQHRLAPAAG